MDSFSEALDRLISEWKAKGADLGEMVADLRGAADGLAGEEEE
jgi:hypothetical protein